MQETASAQTISSYASSRLINYKGTNTDGLRQKNGCFRHASPTWQQTSQNGDVTKQNLWWFCGSTAFRWSNAKFGPHFLLNKVIQLARVMPVIKTRRALCTFPCGKLGAPLVCLVSHRNDSKDAKMPNQGWHGYPIPLIITQNKPKSYKYHAFQEMSLEPNMKPTDCDCQNFENHGRTHISQRI